jgi:hypothetical protein
MYQGTTERICTRCGRTFWGGTNQTCNPCRTIDRECITCGTQFRGRERKCYDCRASDRPCKICGHIFHDTKRTCERCRKNLGTCQMPGCTESKLRGRGHRYCTQHNAEGPQRESVQVVRRKREREFGLTHEEFLALHRTQGGVCAICGNGNDGPRQLSIDHDHVTGAVRGLLCDRCNPMLGYARDNTAVLEAAIEYLKRNQVFKPPNTVYR